MKANRVMVIVACVMFVAGLLICVVIDKEEGAAKQPRPVARGTKGGEIPPEFIRAAREAIRKADPNADPNSVVVRDEVISSETIDNRTPAQKAEEAAQIEQQADQAEVLGTTKVDRTKPRYVRLPNSRLTMVTLTEKVRRKIGAPSEASLNENLKEDRHPEVTDQLRAYEKGFTGKPVQAKLFELPYGSTREDAIRQMAQEGYQPATPEVGYSYMLKMSVRDRGVRINVLGGEPLQLADGPHYVYFQWQPDRNWYGAATWAVSLNRADPVGGYGQNWPDHTDPRNPIEYALGFRSLQSNDK